MSVRNSYATSGAALLVLFAGIATETGAAIAVLIFPALGPMGVVSLRIAFSAILLLIVSRPALRGRRRSDWTTAIWFGLALATMNTTFYFAIERIPLGVAVTIEVLGPLILSVVMGRRLLNWAWALLALVGVVLLCGIDVGRLDPLGVVFAVIAGLGWAGYILGSARTGRRFAQLDGLAIAMTVGAIVTLPFGIATAGASMLSLQLLGIALLVAVLSSAVPYALEFLALRRLPESTFGVLMSLAPATAAIAGFVVLHQRLTPLDLVAIGLVTAASIGAVLTTPTKAPLSAPLP